MEAFEWKGIWWLPSNPDKRIPGTLSFSPEQGATLTLFGSLPSPEGDDGSESPKYIHGTQEDGCKVTLYKCLWHRSGSAGGSSTPRYCVSTFEPRVVFKHAHFSHDSPPRFKLMRISYNHLAEWARLSGLEMRLIDKPSTPIEFKAFYRFPEEVHEVSLQGFRVRFWHAINTLPTISEMRWREEVFWEVEPDQPQEFEHYRNEVFSHLQEFLSFCIGLPIYETRLIGCVPHTAAESGLVERPVEAFFPRPPFSKPSDRLRETLLKFRLPDLGDDYPRLLSAWFDSSKRLRPVFDLYFANLFSPYLYGQNQFLNLAQALEVYHARTQNVRYMSRRKFRDLRAKIIDLIQAEARSSTEASPTGHGEFSTVNGDQIPEAFLAVMPGKLAPLNQPNLHTRLEQLVSLFREELKPIVHDLDSFPLAVVKTRNHLTHFSGKEDEVIPTARLPLAVMYLKFVLELCLLKELEVPNRLVTAIVASRQRDLKAAKIVEYT